MTSDFWQKNRVLIQCLIVLFVFTGSFGTWVWAQNMQGKPAFTPELLEQGKNIFERQCAVCHGDKGDGKGDAAFLLYPKPRDFTMGEFRLISTTTQQATDEDLFKTITRGMPGSSMPPWSHLSEEDRWALVHYVRHLSKAGQSDKTEVINLEDLIRPSSESKITRESLEEGKKLYVQACLSCHGADGKGLVPQAMFDGQGAPIRARDFTLGIFKGGSGSTELYHRMVAGMPGAPMPSYSAAYSDSQIWDLIHYVQSFIKPGVQEKVEQKQTAFSAGKISGALPESPEDKAWEKIPSTYIALMPLWWRPDYIQGVEVKAVHNGVDFVILLTWDDATKNESVVRPQDFTDGAAVEFSLDPDPPFFGMGGGSVKSGEEHGMVSLWHWKAVWELDKIKRQDVDTQYPNMAYDFYPGQKNWQYATHPELSKSGAEFQEPLNLAGHYVGNPLSDPNRSSSVEVGNARKQGTFTTQKYVAQDVKGEGLWKDGKWKLMLTHPMNAGDPLDVKLASGETVALAFAVWEGESKDRNGQKCVSIWHKMKVE